MKFGDLFLWWSAYLVATGLIPLTLMLYLQFPAKIRLRKADEIIKQVTRPTVRAPDPDVEALCRKFVDSTQHAIRRKYEYREYWIPIVFITIVLAIGFFLVFSSGYPLFKLDTLDELLFAIPNTVFYGFVGGCFYALFAIVGRYHSGDLTPPLISHLSCHVLLAGAVAYFASTLVPDTLDSGLAFASGFVPYREITAWLTSRSRQTLGIQRQESTDDQDSNRAKSNNLSSIVGIATEHRERLQEEDIMTVQNLAFTNPLYLYIVTPFTMGRIIDWIDQALLLLFVPVEKVERLGPIGIRGAIELSQIIDPPGPADTEYDLEAVLPTPHAPIPGNTPTSAEVREYPIKIEPQGEDDVESRLATLAGILGVSQVGAANLVDQVKNDPQVRFLVSMWREFGGS